MTGLLAEESAVATEPEFASARLTAVGASLALLVSALWGTNPAALKIVLRSFPPLGSAGLRFAVAALGVVVLSRAAGIRLSPPRGEIAALAINSGLFIAQIASFTLGVYWGTASHSVVLLQTYPFFVVAMAHFLIPGDRASWGRIAGVLCAFGGIVAIFLGQGGRWQGTLLLGDVTQVVSSLLLAIQIIFLKRVLDRTDPNRVVFWQMAVGAIAFLVYSFGREGLAAVRPAPAPLVALIYQGLIIGTFCFTVWMYLLRRHSASLIAIFGFVGPVIGVALSSFALGEPFTPALALSAALVAGGIILGNLR
jgi:drug/metabolite transporter (DMT)-like permease